VDGAEFILVALFFKLSRTKIKFLPRKCQPSNDGNMAKGKHSGSSTGRGRGRSGGKRPRAANTYTRRGLLASDDVAREPSVDEEGNDEDPSSSGSSSTRLCSPP
jgi:hypothetical protein